ncbi:hypothetical protein FRC10_012276 [Ceratobasidium sp. 414]|nr:hypothetical protein FRC10_012276 [Ceratobasidium sp. 414]
MRDRFTMTDDFGRDSVELAVSVGNARTGLMRDKTEKIVNILGFSGSEGYAGHIRIKAGEVPGVESKQDPPFLDLIAALDGQQNGTGGQREWVFDVIAR